jgi:fibronectin-binding autotransporter adhesin
MKTICTLIALTIASVAALPLRAANRYWIAASTAAWNSTANWSTASGGASGASVPGNADVAIFDNNGLGNCTIPAALTISSLLVNSGYTGTITQGAVTITISGAATFSGGTFTGSASAVTFGGAVTISGATVTLPTQVNMNGGSWTYTSGTLDALTNSSNVTFANGITITGSQTFNNLTYTNTTPWGMTYTLAAGTVLTVNGNISTTGTQTQTFSAGTIDLLGNLSLVNTATGGGGSTILTFDGTGNQAITGTLTIGQSALPAVNINKASGTLTLPAMISEGGSAWTYTTGTIDATTNNSTVDFVNGVTITGSHTLNNITFSNTTPWGMTYTIAAGTTLTAAGTVTMTGSATQTFSGGTIALLGGLSLANTATGGGGTTVLSFTGTGNQAVTGSPTLGQNALPSVSINKASGTLTLNSLLSVAGSTWTYTAGTIDATTNNNTVVFDGNITISGSQTLNNIDFDNSTPWGMTYTLSAGTTLSSTGTVILSGISGQTYSGGTLALLGNLTLTNTSTADGGTTVFAFTGTTNQTITSSLPINEGALPSVNINKASGTLQFPAILTMAGSAWTYTTGTLDVTTNNSTVVFAGNTTITGSHTLNNVTFNNATPWNTTLTFSAGTVLTVSGTLSMGGASAITLSGGTVDLLGGLSLANTSTGDGGTTVLAFVGTGNQTITSSLPANENDLPSVNINKASGTLQFPAILTMAGSSWTYTAGALDVTTNNSTVYFGGNTTFSGSHTLNNVNFDNATPWGINYTVTAGTTLTIAGTMTMSGASSMNFAGGTLALQGNLNLTNTSTGDGGSTVLSFIGTGNQTISSSLPVKENSLPAIAINKPSGTLSFPAILTVAGNAWTYTAGTVDATTNTSTVDFTNNATINSNGMNFYNFSVLGGTSTLGNNLAVSNNLTITSPGVLSGGANTINLLGNWSDWGSAGFTRATSTVNFAGTALQTITAPGGEIFANLTVNNTAIGIQLENNATVYKTLTMTQGNIDLNTNTLTIGQNAANPGSLAYTAGTAVNTGSITRWLKTGVIATGSTAGLFPTGTTTDYRPFTVTAPTTGPTTGGTITVSYTDAVTNTSVSFPDGASTVQIRKNLNWAVATGNGLNGGSYNLQISGTGYQQIGSVSDLRLTLVNSVTGTAGVNAGTTTDPQVNRTGVTLANLTNTFYLGSVNPGFTTLPITILSFGAHAADGTVVLGWTATLAGDNANFTVQRSKDGVAWDSLTAVAGEGAGTTAGYTATDAAPLEGVSYYRLLMTEEDGSVTYSSVAVVNLTGAATTTLSVYPNPVVSMLTIAGSQLGDFSVSVFNELGQVMTQVRAENASQVQLNVSGFAAGVYFVRISGTGWVETKKIVVRH